MTRSNSGAGPDVAREIVSRKSTQASEMLTVAQAALRLGASTNFVYGQCYAGKLPYYNFGGDCMRISVKVLDRYIESNGYGFGRRNTRSYGG